MVAHAGLGGRRRVFANSSMLYIGISDYSVIDPTMYIFSSFCLMTLGAPEQKWRSMDIGNYIWETFLAQDPGAALHSFKIKI